MHGMHDGSSGFPPGYATGYISDEFLLEITLYIQNNRLKLVLYEYKTPGLQ